MAHVDQVGGLRPELVEQGQRLRKRKMGRMRGRPQRIQDQNIERIQCLHGSRRDAIAVGAVSELPDAVAEDFEISMPEGNWDHANSEELERLPHRAQIEARLAAAFLRLGEGVPEGAPKSREGAGTAVDRKVRLLAEIVDAQVVQPHNMIGVTMSVEDRIQAIDPVPESLLSEIAGGVHKNAPVVPLQKNGRPQALVARIRGCANTAAATNHRHASGGPRAQKGDSHASWPMRRRMLAASLESGWAGAASFYQRI